MTDYNMNEILKNIKNTIESETKETGKPSKMECLILSEDMVISNNKPKTIKPENINTIAKILTYNIVKELGIAKDTQTIYRIIRKGLNQNL